MDGPPGRTCSGRARWVRAVDTGRKQTWTMGSRAPPAAAGAVLRAMVYGTPGGVKQIPEEEKSRGRLPPAARKWSGTLPRSLSQRRLRRRQPGDGHPERRAADVVQPDLVAE